MKIPKPDRLRDFCFFACFVCGLRFSFVLIVRKEDRIGKVILSHFFAYGEEQHRHGVFSAFLCLWKEATPLWCFFRISLLVQRNARKENTLTPFSRKGGKPPKRGLAQPQNSPSWVRAPTAKPSECRQDGDAELASPFGGGGICGANGGEGLVGCGHPDKGMFFRFVWSFGTPLPIPIETK